MIKLNILAGLVIVMITSCLNMEKYERQEEEEIRKFLLQNPDLNFELKPSGLYYLDIVVGTGIRPVTHDTAYIMQTSRYLDGNIFSTNAGTTDTLIRPVNEG